MKAAATSSVNDRDGSRLILIPLKRTADIDITKQLKNVILAIQGSIKDKGDTQTLSEAEVGERLRKLQQLRDNALIKSQDASTVGSCGETLVENLEKYYDQLCYLESKIPFNSVKIAFKWKNAFDKSGIFAYRTSLTLQSLYFEKVCVMFNLAAKYANVVTTVDLGLEDNLQKAVKRMQMSAGIFAYLRGAVSQLLQQDATTQSTSDLDADVLGVLADITLAQAQELVLMKAQGKMKDSLVARLAMQCCEMYANVFRSMQKETVKSVLSDTLNVGGGDSKQYTNMTSLVIVKQYLYRGIADYHQSLVLGAEKSFGPQVARLQNAANLFKLASDKAGSDDSRMLNLGAWVKRNDQELANAVKYNDFIYHETVPSVKTLPAIEPAAVAKATQLPTQPPIGAVFGHAMRADDLFGELMPVALHQASVSFEARRRAMIEAEMHRLAEAESSLNQRLTSMNLPAAVERTKAGQIPQSIRDKANKVRDAGGLAELEKKLVEVPQMHKRNLELLEECDRIMAEEAKTDSEMRTKFGPAKWKRTESATLTKAFKENANKFRSIIQTAKQTDDSIKSMLDDHRSVISSLSMGGDILQKDIGSTLASTDSLESSGNTSHVAAVIKLRQLLEEVESLRAVRLVLQSELREVTVDARQQFLAALQRDGMIDEEQITMQMMGPALEPFKKQVTESIQTQDGLMDKVSKANSDFVSSKPKPAGSKDKQQSGDDFLRKLAAGYDAWVKIKASLEEAATFYGNLTQLLVSFQSKLSDFVYARTTEKEELMRDITAKLASVDMKDVKPTRPPPPVIENAQQATVLPVANPTMPVPAQPTLPYPIQPNMAFGTLPMPMMAYPHILPQGPYLGAPGMPIPAQNMASYATVYNPYAQQMVNPYAASAQQSTANVLDSNAGTNVDTTPSLTPSSGDKK